MLKECASGHVQTLVKHGLLMPALLSQRGGSLSLN